MQSMNNAKKSNPAKINIIFCCSAAEYDLLILLIWSRTFGADGAGVSTEVDLLSPAVLVESGVAGLLALALLLDSV